MMATTNLKVSMCRDYLYWKYESTEVKTLGAKIEAKRSQAESLLENDRMSARKLVLILGKMSAAILATQPAHLHYRELQGATGIKTQSIEMRGYNTKRSHLRGHGMTSPGG